MRFRELQRVGIIGIADVYREGYEGSSEEELQAWEDVIKRMDQFAIIVAAAWRANIS